MWKAKPRVIDAVGIAILLCLIASGFFADPNPVGFDYSILVVGVLALASFVGVIYSFRVYTRILWLIGTPLGALVLPALGSEVYASLSPRLVVVNTEDPALMLVCYLAFLIFWSLIRAFGWRLRAEPNEIVRDQLKLHELFAITAIMACGLVMAKTYFKLGDFNLIAAIRGNGGLGMLGVVANIVFIFGGVVFGLMLGRRLWFFLSILVPCFAYLLFWWWSVSSLAYLAMPVAILMVACLVARQVGFRLARSSTVEADP